MFIPTACNFYLFRSTVDRKQLTGLATSTARNIKTVLAQPNLEVVDNKHSINSRVSKVVADYDDILTQSRYSSPSTYAIIVSSKENSITGGKIA